MKSWREVRPIVRAAVEATGGRAEFKDRHAPTWDGRCWHFARVRAEVHVVHEVAHWLAFPEGRRFENYGLGRDPDGGPRTGMHAVEILFPELPRLLAETDDDGRKAISEDDAFALIRNSLSWEEEVATVLSCRLLVDLGYTAWKGEANRTHLLDMRNWWKIWTIAELLKERGVDVYDPIPGITSPRPLPLATAR